MFGPPRFASRVHRQRFGMVLPPPVHPRMVHANPGKHQRLGIGRNAVVHHLLKMGEIRLPPVGARRYIGQMQHQGMQVNPPSGRHPDFIRQHWLPVFRLAVAEEEKRGRLLSADEQAGNTVHRLHAAR